MKLTILVTSDIHGHVFARDYVDGHEKNLGMLKLKTLIEKEKEKNESTITIDLGDFIQGSMLAQYLYEVKKTPKYLYQIKNEMGYELEVIGNHEFNFGLAYLKKAIESSNIPSLSANILDKDDKPVYFPFKIIEKKSIKIAIIGITTQFIKNWELEENIEGLKFEPAKKTLEKYVNLLKDKADAIVCAYHGGFERDLYTNDFLDFNIGENEGFDILKNVKDIDVLLTGHQHRKIADVIDNVAIIQPGYWGESLGKIELQFDENKNIIGKTSELLGLENISVDKETENKYSYMNHEFSSWMNEIIGIADDKLRIDKADDARLFGHAYANFVNEVQLYYSNADISATSIFLNDSKGLSLEVTRKDILSNYPYTNTLAVIEVTGEELKEVLCQNSMYFVVKDNQISVNQDYLHPKPKYYNYDFYYNIDYVIDVSKSKEDRIVSLSYKGNIIKDEDKFELVTNQYRALGGGDFDTFKGKKILRTYESSINNLMIDYIREKKRIIANNKRNFRFIK